MAVVERSADETAIRQSGSPQLAPGQFNPFGSAGGTGAGGAISAGAAAFRPRQEGQPGGGQQPGGGDYNVTVQSTTDPAGIKKSLQHDFTDRTRVVGPQG